MRKKDRKLLLQIANNQERLKENSNSLKKEELELKKRELELKDRVDISRKEYDEINKKMEMLECDCAGYKAVLDKFKILPFLPAMEIETLKVDYYDDFASLKRKACIRFDVDKTKMEDLH